LGLSVFLIDRARIDNGQINFLGLWLVFYEQMIGLAKILLNIEFDYLGQFIH